MLGVQNRLENMKSKMILQIHDELIIECKPEVSLDELCRQMARVPDWMQGLKLDAAGYVTPWYCKD